MNRVRAVMLCWGAALLPATPGAQAQVPVPGQAAQAATAGPAASGAAMDRARRLADSPLKAIIEAGKNQKRPAAEPVPTPGAAVSIRPSAVPALPAPSAPSAPSALPALPEPPAPAEAVLNADSAMSRPTPEARSGLPGSSDATAPVPVSSADAWALPATLAPALSGPVQPQLLSKVEPAISPRLLTEIGPLSQVMFDLSLRADGTVADATLVPPAPRQLQRALGPILMQWRYAPLPAPQVHRIELSFTTP